MFSISTEESLPTVLLMVMLALRPDVFSVAVSLYIIRQSMDTYQERLTLRIPFTSTSNTHSSTASPALMGRNWRESELAQGGIVLAVDALTLYTGNWTR
ncbi:hypothetical protein MRB53_038682 [Persea americana]|nr:hypothetical protein MRB53_038682 [Persea americana]